MPCKQGFNCRMQLLHVALEFHGWRKFLRTAFLAAKLLGWKVSVKGIRSSLSEADGSKADSLLTFWTRLSALDKMLSG